MDARRGEVEPLAPSPVPPPPCSQFVHRIDIRIQGVFMDEDPCAFKVG